jgi:Flp pilus assembly protein TadG
MNLLSRFLKDRRGTIAVTFAIAAIPLAGVSGAAVDYSRAVQVKHKLEIATDAAALAAAGLKTNSPAERNAAAERLVRSSIPRELNVAVSATSSSDADVTVVDITTSASVKTSLLQLLKIPNVEVSARSKAARPNADNGPPPCVLALNKTAPASIDIGGSSVFDGRSCVLHANSVANGAMSVSGSAKVNAGGYCAVGTVTSYYTLTPTPTNKCRPMWDTYARLTAPSDTMCRQNLTNVSVNPNQKKTLDPGVYCGGLSLKGDVTLNPGLYVIKDGQLSMNSSGTIKGTGVTFYLVGSNAGFDLNGGSTLELTPMKAGAYAGLLLVQDRTSNVGGTSKVNGNATTNLKGAIYAPTQTIRLNGTGTFGQLSPFMPMIADKIVITGNATAKADSTDVPLVAPLPHVETAARLVE